MAKEFELTGEIVVRGGTVVDGTGRPGRPAEVLISEGRITEIADKVSATGGARSLDATDCVVAPGFINVLSHAYVSLQRDPRGLSDLYQGITTEIFGEGVSLGPVVGKMTSEMLGLGIRDPEVRTSWPTLGSFLNGLADAGVGPNVASLVGAANLRMSVAGLEPRPLSSDEITAACALLDSELADGALGVGAALIYPPGTYADHAELAAYCALVAKHDGLYAAHIRSEGDRLEEGVHEVIELARQTGVRAEVFHLKALGRQNWAKLARVLDHIDAARREGLAITADVYPYAAGATGLAASLPPAVLEGGTAGLQEALSSPAGRADVREMCARGVDGWENLWALAGGADGVVILSSVPELDIQPGTRVAEAAARRHADPLELVMDVLQARPGTDAAYFMADEKNVKLAFQRPWVGVGSDSDAPALSELFDPHGAHPRAYGAFARILGRYVRDNHVVSLEEAVRRMSGLPAATLRLEDRGLIRVGAHADLAIFDPATVQDHATYDRPAAYASGMRHVLVNGVAALEDETPTGALAGCALRRQVRG